MLKERVVWESENGKYRVLVRLFEGDPIPQVDVWQIVKGRKKPVRYFEIPEYVREKINELKSWVKHMGGE